VQALEDSVVLGCGSALHLTQALVRVMSPARLWLVTRGAQAVSADARGVAGSSHVAGTSRMAPLEVQQAPLNGLALVIEQEHPELRCTSIDLEAIEPSAAPAATQTAAIAAQATTIGSELIADTHESRVAWRDGVRYVSRIERATLPAAVSSTSRDGAERVALRSDATYLITGGLGALGLRTAAAFARAGAKHLVLTGRTGARPTAIDAIERAGATVVIARADVSEPADVDRLFDQVLAALPPLAGVVHAAGVLDDALMAQQSIERLRTVYAPKVHGTWNLHLRTRELPLDFFVCYSSAASLVGSPGQGNYAAGNAFMDAVAYHRRALGLPGSSINWGAWDGDGMAATPQMRQRLEARGVRTIQPAAGLRVLFRLLGMQPQAVTTVNASTTRTAVTAAATAAAIGVMPVDWPRFLLQFGPGVPSRFTKLAAHSAVGNGRGALGEQSAGLAATPASTAAAAANASATSTSTPTAVGTSSRLAELHAASRATRGPLLRRYLRDEVAAVLGFDASVEIGLRERYFDLGMDSLMTVELRNRLQHGLALALPSTLAFDYPTLDSLATWLDGLLEETRPVATAVAATTVVTAATAAAAVTNAPDDMMTPDAMPADALPGNALPPSRDMLGVQAMSSNASADRGGRGDRHGRNADDLDSLSAAEIAQLLASELDGDGEVSRVR
jgi:NAD(P)-dependent dehydrogenase (short-subunit alcohol dehydrogenase family)